MGSGLENLEYGGTDPSRWPRYTIFPTIGGCLVGIVRLLTPATELSYSFWPVRWRQAESRQPWWFAVDICSRRYFPPFGGGYCYTRLLHTFLHTPLTPPPPEFLGSTFFRNVGTATRSHTIQRPKNRTNARWRLSAVICTKLCQNYKGRFLKRFWRVFRRVPLRISSGLSTILPEVSRVCVCVCVCPSGQI
jgi:hypothetical protein